MRITRVSREPGALPDSLLVSLLSPFSFPAFRPSLRLRVFRLLSLRSFLLFLRPLTSLMGLRPWLLSLRSLLLPLLLLMYLLRLRSRLLNLRWSRWPLDSLLRWLLLLLSLLLMLLDLRSLLILLLPLLS